MSKHPLMRSYVRFVILILCVGSLLTSCEKDEVLIDFPANTVQADDPLLKIFSEQLVDAMEHPEVVEFIKNETAKQFDGDYNFLVREGARQIISIAGRPDVKTFGDIFGGYSGSTGNQKGKESLLQELQNKYPLLQIALPQLNYEGFEPDDLIQIVGYVPFEDDNSGVPIVNAGHRWSSVSSYEMPDDLIVVVSHNERLHHQTLKKSFEVGKSMCPEPQLVYDYGDDRYYDYDEYLNYQLCTKGGPGGPITPKNAPPVDEDFPCPSSDRANSRVRDQLFRVKYRSVEAFKRYQEWHDGKVELEVRIDFAQTANSSDFAIFPLTRKHDDVKVCRFLGPCRVKWIDVNQEIVRWDPNIHGSEMRYTWIERDNGPNFDLAIKFSLSIGTGTSGANASLPFEISTTWQIRSNDDRLGALPVEYCSTTHNPVNNRRTDAIEFDVGQDL